MSELEGAGTASDIGLPDDLRQAIVAVEANKGLDVLVLDLREVASFTDYLLICTGRGERHVQAIVDAIVDKLVAEKVKPLHTEGYKQGTWVLVDFVDFLVNVFTPETRDFYQLERVWRDAPVLLGEPMGVVDRESADRSALPSPDDDDDAPAATDAADG